MRMTFTRSVTTTRTILMMSKRDVAAAISVRPETLSRAIRRLTDEGLLSWQGRRLIVNAAAWDQV